MSHEWKPGDQFIVRHSWGYGFDVRFATAVKPKQLWVEGKYRREVFDKAAAIPYSVELIKELRVLEQEYEDEQRRSSAALMAIRNKGEELIARAVSTEAPL